MKKAMKLAGLLLAIVMIVSMMSVVAFAEDFTITVENPINGKTYTAYKVFDIVDYTPAVEENLEHDPPISAEAAKAVYKVNSDFAALFATGADGLNYFDISDDANEFVTVKTGVDLAEFAKIALAFAKENEIDAAGNATAASNAAVITVTSVGYYLVDSTTGSLCALTSTVPNAVIEEKNTVPTVLKEVTAVGTDTTDKATASVGETVSYSATITAYPGAENYVYIDSMDTGLTWSGTVVVSDGDTLTAGEDKDYTLVTTGLGTGETFKVVFNKSYLDSIEATTTITITYTAVVNENAIDDAGSIDNKADLKYGDNGEATSSTASINTYSFQLVKIDGSSKKAIDGATFKLYDASTGGNEILLVKDGDVYRPATTAEKEASGFTPAVVPAGVATIDGLGNGTYYLEEDAVPSGYNKINERAEVTINGADNTFSAAPVLGESTASITGGVKVENNQGSVLPETGGVGTTLVYILGVALVLGAAVMLVSKKRMATAE